MTLDALIVRGKQRPTKNSRDQQIHPEESGIVAFWEWFGDSKIVDQHGRPLVFFHGCNFDIDSFRTNDDGLIFSTPSPTEASGFTNSRGGANENDGVIYPLYIRARKPFDFQNPKHIQQLKAALPYGVYIKDEYLHSGFFAYLEERAVLSTIKRLGFDALFVRENEKNLAVFSPDQIKSALGNSGDFLNGESIADVARPTMIQRMRP